MSNTPGQDPQARTIDAQALQDQLIEFMLETALRQKRFQNLIDLMEQVTAVARSKQGDDWKAALEQLRKDLARAPLQEISAQITASESRIVKELNQTRALLSGAGSAAGSPELREIKTQLSQLESQVAALAGRPPATRRFPAYDSPPSPERDPQRPRAGDGWLAWLRSPVVTIVSLLVAVVAVTVLILGPGASQTAADSATQSSPPAGPPETAPPSAAPATPGANSTESKPEVAPATGAAAAGPSSPAATASSPPVAATSGWQLAWGLALVQPAICADDPKKRVAFAHCVCPEAASAVALGPNNTAGTPVPGLSTRCPLDDKKVHTNSRLAVMALQAVLMSAGRVAGNAPGRADGDLGEHTINAIKVLKTCQSLSQAESHALSVLENKPGAPEQQGLAAWKVLTFLKGDPTCLSPRP